MKHLLWTLMLLFIAPSIFAKVNDEDVRAALEICNDDVILTQHNETASAYYMKDNGGVARLTIQRFSSRTGMNLFDVNYYSVLSGVNVVTVSKDDSLKNGLSGFYSVNVSCKDQYCFKDMFLYSTGSIARGYIQNSYIAVCNSESKARRVADMLSKALHL